MKRKKPINLDLMKRIEPLTENQQELFRCYKNDQNLVAYGCAGTGKTFITLYNALQDVLSEKTPYEKIYIVRSLVATREIGFLPGDHEDKSSLYQIPYKNMVKYMFEMPTDSDFEMLYGNLKTQGTISFWSTSFIRGTTLDNAIVIVDEFQNLNYHELDSIITRVGENTKIMFCGDATQSDLLKQNERNGIVDFMRILRLMPSVDMVEFGVDHAGADDLFSNFQFRIVGGHPGVSPGIEHLGQKGNQTTGLNRYGVQSRPTQGFGHGQGGERVRIQEILPGRELEAHQQAKISHRDIVGAF